MKEGGRNGRREKLLLFFLFGCTVHNMQDPSSLTRYRTLPAALGVRSLNHWNAREVPKEPRYRRQGFNFWYTLHRIVINRYTLRRVKQYFIISKNIYDNFSEHERGSLLYLEVLKFKSYLFDIGKFQVLDED